MAWSRGLVIFCMASVGILFDRDRMKFCMAIVILFPWRGALFLAISLFMELSDVHHIASLFQCL